MENTEKKEKKEPAKVVLDKDYFITADNFCWTLNLEREGEISKTTGKPTVSRKQTFHGSLKYALLDYADNSLVPCKDATEILAALARVEEAINKIDFSPFARNATGNGAEQSEAQNEA